MLDLCMHACQGSHLSVQAVAWWLQQHHAPPALAVQLAYSLQKQAQQKLALSSAAWLVARLHAVVQLTLQCVPVLRLEPVEGLLQLAQPLFC